MQLGVVFPQNEIGTDPVGIRDYVQAVEGLGYSHLVVYDHVVGADPTHRPGWQGYTFQHMFHEPFVLFGYLAALTQLELVTGVIILPQRQTVLVAKQAAEVAVCRLRLSGARPQRSPPRAGQYSIRSSQVSHSTPTTSSTRATARVLGITKLYRRLFVRNVQKGSGALIHSV